jgi:uncharacterized protein (TIGR00730 family)
MAAKPSSIEGQVRITVFGGSKPQEGSQPYQEAQRLGSLLGTAGYTVLTGGYIGTMEAVSRGASQAGGHVIGVTCDEIESWRPVGPNPWVEEEMRFPTLKERLYALVENCHAAIALPGGIGTLAEISVMWSQIQTGAISPRALVLVGGGWEATFSMFYDRLGDYIPEGDHRWLRFSPTVEEAVQIVKDEVE